MTALAQAERDDPATELARWRSQCECTENHRRYPGCDGEICIAQRNAIAAAFSALERPVSPARTSPVGALRDLLADIDDMSEIPQEISAASLARARQAVAEHERALVADQRPEVKS